SVFSFELLTAGLRRVRGQFGGEGVATIVAPSPLAVSVLWPVAPEAKQSVIRILSRYSFSGLFHERYHPETLRIDKICIINFVRHRADRLNCKGRSLLTSIPRHEGALCFTGRPLAEVLVQRATAWQTV